LGEFGVEKDGQPVALGPPKQRLVLAVLLCRPDETVSTAALVDALWGASPPPSAGDNLRLYVHRLRQVLGPRVLSRRGRLGYLLAADGITVDAHRFIQLITAGFVAIAGNEHAIARSRLHEALGLWRGSPYGDLANEPALAQEVAKLEELRVTAFRKRIEIDLAAGRAAELVPELNSLIAEHPFHERFHSQRMLALYRLGRQTDALAAYRETRRVLVSELGIEPGTELRELEQAILRHDPALDARPTGVLDNAPRSGVRPAMLPAAVAYLTGRDAELTELDALGVGANAVAMPIATVVGPAGIGKTALAVHWGHLAATRYPDGQLFVNLRGFDPQRPLRPIDALARLLRALGVESDQIPADLDDAAALYRSLLAGRRVMVVLDNARSAAQVRPLLPGSPGCVAVVTSRERLTDLVGQMAAHRLVLEPLPEDRAIELLDHIVKRQRVSNEPDAARDLVVICGRLPLALCIAAANLADRPQLSIARYVAELLVEDRLAALRVDNGGIELRSTFDMSYAALTPSVQQTFRTLGLIPGPDFTSATAAAMCGISPEAMNRRLGRLANAHLVQRHGPDRFAFHDLLREYARHKATDVDQAALGRLLDHYVERCRAVAQSVYPQLLRLPSDRTPGTPAPAALEWLHAELPNLVAACVHASAHGPHRVAWLLADALRGYFWQRRNTLDWRIVADAAASAAETTGDPAARTAVQLNLGQLHYCLRDYPQAVAYYTSALAFARSAAWRRAESTVLGNLASVHADSGDLRQAAENFGAALVIHREVGFLPGEAVTLGNLGQLKAYVGNLAEAAALFVQALALHREQRSVAGQAVILGNLSEVEIQLGHLDEAGPLAREALDLARRAGRLDAETLALTHLSAVHRGRGELAAAVDRAEEAVKVIGGANDRAIEATARNSLATGSRLAGDPKRAIEEHSRALALASGTGSTFIEAETLIGLSAAYHGIGDAASAGEHATRAIAIARAAGFGGLERRAVALLAEVRG
jgi:DNA-binding SARP family transcriptional activator